MSLVLAVVVTMAAPALSEVVALNSGGGYAFGQNDPQWTYLSGPPGQALSLVPFTAADFAAALSGPQSFVVPPYGGGSLWIPQLGCDLVAQWISTDPNAGPATALYGTTFNVETCCISSAKLRFCWASDDNIGDQLYGGGNPMGLYLNGTPLSFTGGSYATTTGGIEDVTALLHCGQNQIHVYNRDAAFVVTGVMFQVLIDITGCPIKTEQTTWGKVKSLYQ